MDMWRCLFAIGAGRRERVLVNTRHPQKQIAVMSVLDEHDIQRAKVTKEGDFDAALLLWDWSEI